MFKRTDPGAHCASDVLLVETAVSVTEILRPRRLLRGGPTVPRGRNLGENRTFREPEDCSVTKSSFTHVEPGYGTCEKRDGTSSFTITERRPVGLPCLGVSTPSTPSLLSRTLPRRRKERTTFDSDTGTRTYTHVYTGTYTYDPFRPPTSVLIL